MQEVENIYGVSNAPAMLRSATTEMVASRQAQEVQAAMVIAKRFPAMRWKAIIASFRRANGRPLRSRRCMSIRAAIPK